MTSENGLIIKSYYQTMIDETKNGHPIKILGEMYMKEMQKQRPELSSIRFAQGEVYFKNQDYEAAIYKWQHPLDDPFIPWAQKNIADAHLEMGLLEHAEKFYREIKTESLELKSEVLLQLFSLYIQQDKRELAVDTIKQAVRLNPDYSQVTELAQSYFEDIKDWDSGIELTVNEAIRTNALPWFEVLEGYAKHGLTSNYNPSYFKEMLETLLQLDKYRFEIFTEVLWNSYMQSDFYIPWLEEINQILLDHTAEPTYMWKKLPNLFEETYVDLISGRFLIRDISTLCHSHLTNWLELSSVSDTLIPSSAIIAWDEIFPSELETSLIKKAENSFESAKPYQDGRQEGTILFDSIKIWAEKEGLLEEFSEFIKPMIEEYNMEVASPSRIRNIIKTSIEILVDQRVELENAIMEEMNWNEELLARLHGMTHQISDMEKEKVNIMISSFHEIRQDFIQKMMHDIPKLLQSCSELVQEDSDYTKLHVEINEEMNRRIIDYIENTSLPNFKGTIEEWIEDCKDKFEDTQTTLNEWSESFNQQYNEEKIVLQGDFKILDDWKRDMERITRGMLRIKKVNIMQRNNPSQLLLKGAGKLFGSISKSKDMLHNNYKKYIESADYSQITSDMINPFIHQLEMFEESIEWDSSRFFSNSLDVLNSVSEELKRDLEYRNNSLNTMRENPELYRDPLTLFELRLCQYELVNRIG